MNDLRRKVKVAAVGVGNCFGTLVEGIQFYRDNPHSDGLIFREIGGLKASDIEITGAIDISAAKVGRDVGVAIYEKPNNFQSLFDYTQRYTLNAPVIPGVLFDGMGDHLSEKINVSPSCGSWQTMRPEIVEWLRDSGTDVLLNYLPVGSTQATEFYAAAAFEAGVSFINCIPVPLATRAEWQKQATEQDVFLVGDDIKSQYGATVLHRMIVQLAQVRGMSIVDQYQINVGGNMDFYNMLDVERLKDKKASKTTAVTSIGNSDSQHTHITPAGYIAHLEDRKIAYINLRGLVFGEQPVNIEIKLDVPDSQNSSGCVIDLVRWVYRADVLLRTAGRDAAIDLLSDVEAFYFKSPLTQGNEFVLYDRLKAAAKSAAWE